LVPGKDQNLSIRYRSHCALRFTARAEAFIGDRETIALPPPAVLSGKPDAVFVQNFIER
jgi:hypothetical protein